MSFCAMLVIASFLVQGVHGSIFLVSLLICLVTFVYVASSLTEQMWLDEYVLCFDALFRRRYCIDVRSVSSICFVHEGLNSERGVERCLVQMKDGEHVQISLGPFWRRRDLESFFHLVEEKLSPTSRNVLKR